MNQEKYIGMDVHQATISVAVLDSSGKQIRECILETKAATILEFIAGLRGTLSITFEEGTSAAWLHDLLKPHVSHLVVCDPRRNALSVMVNSDTSARTHAKSAKGTVPHLGAVRRLTDDYIRVTISDREDGLDDRQY
jgi:hypothetical protein